MKAPDISVLIVDDVHPALMERLVAQGVHCNYQPNITRFEALEILDQYGGLVIRSKFKIDREVLKQGERLRFIARAGAGMDNIDTAAAQEAGIICLNAPEGNRDAVGEHALALLLALFTRLTKANSEVKNQIWDREGNRGIELKNKVVGLIGYGFMGQSFAEKLSGFSCTTIAYDKYKTDFSSQHVKDGTMQQIFELSDVLSLHVPLTDETRKMVSIPYLQQFSKPLWLINTSRGEVVDAAALLWGLDSGNVLGAGLDVLETEKFPLAPEANAVKKLIASSQVVLTPHVGGWTTESYLRISQVLAEKILRLVLM